MNPIFPVVFAVTLSLGMATSGQAIAQADPALGPLISPIQPEPRLGLPGQDPSVLQVAEPPPAAPRQAAPAPADQDAPAAAETTAAPTPSIEGDWETECIESPSGASGCQAVVRAAMGNQIALVLAVAAIDGLPRMQMALPLGFSVKNPVRIELGGFEIELPVSRCTAQGCLVEEEASAEFIDALSGARAVGKVAMISVGGELIELPLPVAGAGEALTSAAVVPETQ